MNLAGTSTGVVHTHFLIVHINHKIKVPSCIKKKTGSRDAVIICQFVRLIRSMMQSSIHCLSSVKYFSLINPFFYVSWFQ